MTNKKYTLTDEHRAELKPWADKWIANAMSTKPMDDEDRAAMRIAVKGLYEAADLPPPPDNRIVFVPSPFVLRFAGGFAAAIWHIRKTGFKSDDATDAATDAATRAATYDATRAATRAATYDATDDATRAATYDATRAATYDATDDAPQKIEKWYNFPVRAMISLSAELKLGRFGLECAAKCYWRMYQGGNQWSGVSAFLSFFRHVAKLPLDYSKWEHWESASIHAGPRIMHPEFCMISDRPEVLLVDEQNRPHCETGPFCKWRDGSALYAWHGIRIPGEWIENKASLTPQMALQLENLEERRVVCEILGWAKILKELNAKTIDKHDDPQIGELVEVEIPGSGKERFLKVMCATGREFALCVTHFGHLKAEECNAATYGWQPGMPLEQYIPEYRS